MKSSAKKVELAPYDDLFSTEESRQDAKLEKVREIPLSELHPFKNHPFKVKDDEAMLETADSVRQYRPLENTKQLMGRSTTMSHAPVAAGVALRFSVSWRTNAISAPMSLGVVQSLKWAAHEAAGRSGTNGSLFPTIIRQSWTKNYLKRCRLCSAGSPCRPRKPGSTH